MGGYEVIGRLPGKQAQIPLIPASRLAPRLRAAQGPSRDVRPGRSLSSARTCTSTATATSSSTLSATSSGTTTAGALSACGAGCPTGERDDTPVYRFDYAVEANPLEVPTRKDPRSELVTVSAGHRPTRSHPARRRHLPADHRERVDDGRGAELTTTGHLNALAAPYAKPSPAMAKAATTHSTGPGSSTPTNSFRLRTGGSTWRTAEAAAQRLVRDRDDVRDAVDRASAIASRDAATRLSQLRLRAARSSGSELRLLEEEIHREEVVARALAAAMATPTLRLDSTGMVVLSGRSLTS